MDDEREPNRAPRNTPWGEKQFESYDAELGLTHVETGGHGGIWLDELQRAQIPDYLKKHSQGGEGQWWEEDCAWSLPTMYFLSQRPDKDSSDHFMAEHAMETAREYYPDCYKKLSREKAASGHELGRAKQLASEIRSRASVRGKEEERDR